MANHFFIHIEKVLEVMEITFDTTRIRLAVFRLERGPNMVEMGKDL